MKDIFSIIENLKKDTNYENSIVYREMTINHTTIFIIYNEPLTSANKISDFIIRSLTNIKKNINSKKLYSNIKNNISNFKVNEFKTYADLCNYLHRGYTIILIETIDTGIALETKSDKTRSIAAPETENAIRGSKDAFVEEYQTNLGMIKKRIRNNNLWIDELTIGKYTSTLIGIISINTITDEKILNQVKEKISKINIDGIIDGEIVKNLIEKESKSVWPTTQTTERPDVVCNALISGKIAIVIDNSPYVLIVPSVFNDFVKTSEDYYGKSKNVTYTRFIKYLAFFISLLTPAIYISLITFNQEIIPTKLLVEFAVQRDGVPFPALFEAIIMILCFEILKEADYRVPSFSGSALSIVGALILGEAAVNAGIVSPIMIIVIAITSISSLPFSEPDLTNSIRWYRLLFILGASFLGIIGVAITFLLFLIKLCSIKTYSIPYLAPYSPTIFSTLKDSIYKSPARKITKRNELLTKNIIKQRSNE